MQITIFRFQPQWGQKENYLFIAVKNRSLVTGDPRNHTCLGEWWFGVSWTDWNFNVDVKKKFLVTRKLNRRIEKFHTYGSLFYPQANQLNRWICCRESGRLYLSTIVQEHGLRVTLHPRPAPRYAGTGAHTHISATTLGATEPRKAERFFAGIMMHLHSRIAFAMEESSDHQEASYHHRREFVYAAVWRAVSENIERTHGIGIGVNIQGLDKQERAMKEEQRRN